MEKKKIFITGDSTDKEKIKKLVENVEFVSLPEEGVPNEYIKIAKDFSITMQKMEDVKYLHLSKKEKEAKIESIRTEPKVDRNKPCPCGSGKKYKKCCLNKNI